MLSGSALCIPARRPTGRRPGPLPASARTSPFGRRQIVGVALFKGSRRHPRVDPVKNKFLIRWSAGCPSSVARATQACPAIGKLQKKVRESSGAESSRDSQCHKERNRSERRNLAVDEVGPRKCFRNPQSIAVSRYFGLVLDVLRREE